MAHTLYYFGVFLLLEFVQDSLAITQNLTTSDEGIEIKGATIENLSPSTITKDTNLSKWHISVYQDTDQWSLWLNTHKKWGFHKTSPSLFRVRLFGNSPAFSSSDLLISFSNGLKQKYLTMLIRLNAQKAHFIAPGCDDAHHPTQSFMQGDVYLTMADEPAPGLRMCRPAYIDSSTTCSYTTFGPAANIEWPITFTFRNYPAAGYSTITFEASGYQPISCGFADVFEPNEGSNVWITTLVNDVIEISSVNLEYTLISNPSISPTVATPTNSPSYNTLVAPTFTPTFAPTYNPSVEPTFALTRNTLAAPTFTPTEQPTVVIQHPTLHLVVTYPPIDKTETTVMISTTEESDFGTVSFWDHKSSLIVVVALSAGICAVIMSSAVTCCVYACTSFFETTPGSKRFVSPKSNAASRSIFSQKNENNAIEEENLNQLNQHIEVQEFSASHSSSEHFMPSPTESIPSVPDGNAQNEVMERGVELIELPNEVPVYEGRRTIPERDEIDLLYGDRVRTRYKSSDSTQYTDVESLYDGPKGVIGDTFVIAQPQRVPVIINQLKVSRLIHDTHGTSISLNVEDTAVYGDNESKEDYYDHNEKDSHTDIDIVSINTVPTSGYILESNHKYD